MKSVRAALLLTTILLLCHAAYARPTLPLEGDWEFVSCDAVPPADAVWSPVAVPAIMETPPAGPHTVWFRRRVFVPSSWEGNRAVLRLRGVKYSQKVFLNGKEIGSYLGGFDPTEYDVTTLLRTGDTNELLIAAQDWTALGSGASDPAQLKGKVTSPLGASLSGVGIWGNVWLESRPRVWVDDAFVITSVRERVIQVAVTVKNAGADDQTARLTARVSSGGGGPRFEPETVRVAAGKEATVTLVADWPHPVLWSPENPHLYTLVVGVRVGGLADAQELQFGFREFWTEGSLFYLNGQPLRLRAVSAPQPPYDWSPARFFGTIREAGANAVRLGGQPWPQEWYDAADKAGVLVIAESALCGLAPWYARNDTPFWENARRHLRGLVESLRNHPSVVIWSAESELLASGGATAKNGEQQVGDLASVFLESDSTRPVMFGGDGDPAHRADIVNLHRPHELPRWNQWPETASWFDNPVPLDSYPCGTWQWDCTKPLYLDQFLRLPVGDCNSATIFFGDAAYANPDLYRTLTEVQAREWQALSARDAGVSAISAWTIDEIADPASPARAAMLRAYAPIIAFDLSANTGVLAGKVVERTLRVINDTSAARHLDLTWQLAAADGTWKLDGGQAVHLSPSGRVRVPVTLSLPPVCQERTTAAFTLTLCERGRALYTQTTQWDVFGEAPLRGRPAGAPKQVAIYDPMGETTRMLAQMGVSAVPFDPACPRTVVRDRQIAVLGKGALSADSCTPTGPMMADLTTYVRAGGTLLVFEQTQLPSARLGTSLTSHSSTLAFARDPGHPALRGLTGADLAHWLPTGLVSVGEVTKASWGGYRAIVDSGSASGLATAGLVELRLGKGRVLLSQLDLTAKYGVDPVATRIARNLLVYAAAKPEPRGRLAVVLDPPAPLQLNALCVDFDRFTDGLTDLFQPQYRALIIGDPDRVQPLASALRRYVKQGGRVVFHNVTPANVAAVVAITGLPMTVCEPPGTTVALTNRTGIAAGLSNEELNWYGCDPKTGTLCLSPTVATYQVDLSSVPNATLHTTPGLLASVPSGRGLWVIDQVRWDQPGEHDGLAQRYLATLLTNLGASFGTPRSLVPMGTTIR